MAKSTKKSKKSQQETTEPVISPTEKVAQEAEVERKIDWSPLENNGISGVLDHLAESLLRIKGVEMYRNPGKSDYFGFRVGNMKGVAFIHLAEKRARVSIGEAVTGENGKVRGQFPKNLIFKATEGGFIRGDEKIKVSQIVKRTREYKKARGWA